MDPAIVIFPPDGKLNEEPVKADVEGAELEVIKGALDILKGQRVNLAIASYHMLDGKKTFDRIEDALRSIGYNVDTDHPGHLTTYAFKA